MVNGYEKETHIISLYGGGIGFALARTAIHPLTEGNRGRGQSPILKREKLFQGDNFGAGVSLTRYLKRENYTFVTVEYEQQDMPYREYGVKLKDAFLHVGYMHPILSDRGKNFLFYGGISALSGYEELNKDKTLLPDGATLLDRSRFVYGGAVHGAVEVFLTDKVIFILKAQGRFLFGTDVHHFRPALSAGFRFNL